MKNLSTTAKVIIGVGGTATTASAAAFFIKSEGPLRPILEKEGLSLFNKDTDKKLILTSLSQKLGHPFESFTIPAGTFYPESQEISVEIKGDKGISATDPAIDLLHQHCLKILDEPGGFIEAAKKWCVEIDLREILKRQGLKPLSTNEQAKSSLLYKFTLPLTPFYISAKHFHENSKQVTMSFLENSEGMMLHVNGSALKDPCLEAFKLKDLGENQKYLKNAQTWCVQLSVKDALIRNDFEPLDGSEDDSVWKEIIAGGWFKEKAFFLQKTFSSKKDLFKVTGTGISNASGGIKNVGEVKSEHISALKKECSKLLNQPFSRNNFPNFKNSSNQPIADSFQEASWFCVKPRTAKDFVERTLNKKIQEDEGQECESKLNQKNYEVVQNASNYFDFWNTINSAVTFSVGTTACAS